MARNFIIIKLPVVVTFFLLCSFSLHAQSGTWTWMSGSNGSSVTANFGVQGVASPNNVPPGLYECANWTDLNGNFWIFGGSENNVNGYSALWKFNPVTNEWTWMKGPGSQGQPGVYGTQGVPSPANNPGARYLAMASWTDLSGNLWLFGGYGMATTTTQGYLNDLWKYNIATNEWTWMKGSNIINWAGIYGTLQVPAPSNCPPSRAETTATWVDRNGHLWLYGGVGLDLIPVAYNDMWEYDPATNNWTWMSGLSTPNAPPDYGTFQVPSFGNTPGSGEFYASWKDTADGFWMFGGGELPQTDFGCMWKYDHTTNLWTWMAGSSAANDSGTFTQTCTTSQEFPRARMENKSRWTDDCGRFWQFGGRLLNPPGGYLNDLWMFDPQTNLFTFVDGSTLFDQPGSFGTRLVPSSANYPECGSGSCGFFDLQGNLWMFGGGVGSNFYFGNTLWKYTIDESCLPGFIGGIVPFISISTTSDSCRPTFLFDATFSSTVSCQWNFGDPHASDDTSSLHSTAYTYPEPGTYTVSLTYRTGSSCQRGDTSFIVEVKQKAIPGNFPNVFTPNGEGVNDLFPGFIPQVEHYHLQVYNRYGRIVFETTDPQQEWDGTFNNRACSDGVYYWMAGYASCDGKTQEAKGFVQLIR